jgi:two-component system LytT family response regulator
MRRAERLGGKRDCDSAGEFGGGLMQRAILVDDERLARVQLRRQLARFPQVEIVAEADSVSKGLEAANHFQPDVIFLDIQMPGHSGFDFLEQAGGEFKIIFVTAYDQFALRAFEVNAVDYLLKPVRFERLADALQRVSGSAASLPSANGTPLQYTDYLFVADGLRPQFLKVQAIQYIVAAGSYCEIFTADGRKFMLLQALKEWEERLPPKRFARIHRSCIVNLDCVQRVAALGNDTFEVFLQGKPEPLSISRRYALALKHRLR